MSIQIESPTTLPNEEISFHDFIKLESLDEVKPGDTITNISNQKDLAVVIGKLKRKIATVTDHEELFFPQAKDITSFKYRDLESLQETSFSNNNPLSLNKAMLNILRKFKINGNLQKISLTMLPSEHEYVRTVFATAATRNIAPENYINLLITGELYSNFSNTKLNDFVSTCTLWKVDPQTHGNYNPENQRSTKGRSESPKHVIGQLYIHNKEELKEYRRFVESKSNLQYYLKTVRGINNPVHGGDMSKIPSFNS